jgi:hypothetical protein
MIVRGPAGGTAMQGKYLLLERRSHVLGWNAR